VRRHGANPARTASAAKPVLPSPRRWRQFHFRGFEQAQLLPCHGCVDGRRDDRDAAEAEQQPPEAMPLTPGSAGSLAGTGKRYFEFVGGDSGKFWEIDRVVHTLTVRFGRIGTSGQTQQKICADEAGAIAAAQRLVREKLGKGYVERKAQDGSL
jgi:predicted DNA-binding WGR domain protein